MEKTRAKKLFKRLLGYEVGDHIKIINRKYGTIRMYGIIFYIFSESPWKYLVKYPDGNIAVFKEEDLEYIEGKEFVEKVIKKRKP